jgi:hypothetical protein
MKLGAKNEQDEVEKFINANCQEVGKEKLVGDHSFRPTYISSPYISPRAKCVRVEGEGETKCKGTK